MKSEILSPKARKLSKVSDEEILSSFDPMVEGFSFQVLEEGLNPSHLALSDEASLEIPEVIKTFDLGSALAGIPNKLFFRIGEVAELLDVKTYVLRFWETEFKNIAPTKSRSGQRVYRKKDVEVLFLIKHLLYVERFSIEGARKRIREMKSKTRTEGSKSPTPSVEGSVKAPVQFKGVLDEVKQLANAELSKFFRF